jgi:hypothetical protein
VHFKSVSTDIAPTATTPQKYPAKMGTYFAPRLRRCVVTRKPHTMYGAWNEYRYVWGPSVETTLTKSVRSAYVDVTVVNGPPRPGEYERVLAFDLPQVRLLVVFVPGYLRQEAKAKAEVDITMETIDGKTHEDHQNPAYQRDGYILKGCQRVWGLCFRPVYRGHGKGHSAGIGNSFQPAHYGRGRAPKRDLRMT